MDAKGPPDPFDVLIVYGPLGVFSGLALYFVVRYGTRLLDKHLEFLEYCKTHLEHTRILVEQQTAFLREVRDAMVAELRETRRLIYKLAKRDGEIQEEDR